MVSVIYLLHVGLSLTNTKWKGQRLKVEKAKKGEYSFTKPVLSSDSESDDESSNQVTGKVIGPQKASNSTIMQWIWNEAQEAAEVRRARKRGWKLLKISKEPKVSLLHPYSTFVLSRALIERRKTKNCLS
mgnify:CR=1 FL=1